MKTVLIAEDDSAILTGLEFTFKNEGYNVIPCRKVSEALKEVRRVDLYILDVMFPDGSGYDICKAVKSVSDKPVIFLTACDEEANVVMGLDIGADDYITKPFRIRELISRVRSVNRRYNAASETATIIKINEITINTASAKVYKNDTEIVLTALEYRLLLIFLQNRGHILSRSILLENIWDIDGDFVNDNTLTVYIKRLREKIEADAQNPEIIRTVRGLGYIMD